MRDVDIVQRDPKQAGRQLAHELLGDIDREFIGTRQIARMRREVATESLQHFGQLMQIDVVAAFGGCDKRRLIVVAQQMFVVRVSAGEGSAQKALRQNDARAECPYRMSDARSRRCD